MFRLRKSQEERTMRRFWMSDLGRRLTQHNARYFGPNAGWRAISRKEKRRFAEVLTQRVFGVLQAKNPFIQMRTEMAEMGSNYAELAILTNGGVPEKMRSRFISEQLPDHIRACSAHSEELVAKLAREPTATDDELSQHVHSRSAYFSYHAKWH